jgi:hypothetical protein
MTLGPKAQEESGIAWHEQAFIFSLKKQEEVGPLKHRSLDSHSWCWSYENKVCMGTFPRDALPDTPEDIVKPSLSLHG